MSLVEASTTKCHHPWVIVCPITDFAMFSMSMTRQRKQERDKKVHHAAIVRAHVRKEQRQFLKDQEKDPQTDEEELESEAKPEFFDVCTEENEKKSKKKDKKSKKDKSKKDKKAKQPKKKEEEELQE